jgi:hypothetical protein
MSDIQTQAWRHRIILARDIEVAGDRSAFFKRVRDRELVRLYRGVYISAEAWQGLDRHDRYRARIIAAAHYAPPGLVFSHHSAAALWRLPSVGPWPDKAHVLVPVAAGGRSDSMFVRHTVGVPDSVWSIDGLSVTSLARTVVDLASIFSFGQAVSIADAALHRNEHPVDGVPRTFLTRDELHRELERVPMRHGSARARRAIDFADGAADRPGESMSRVSIRAAGLTMPQLQVPLRGASGRIWTVDFWWPEFSHIGEFDGRDKYVNPEFLRGRTPEEAVYDEKLREDDLREAGHGMSRWPWAVAISPQLIRAKLVAAGIR